MGIEGTLRRLDLVQRRHVALGFPYAVLKRFGETGAGSLAASLAYYGFFSIFPLLLVLVSASAIVLRDRPDLQDRAVGSALAQFPVVGDQIRSNIGTLHGSGLAVVVGGVLALWAGMGAVRAAQVATDEVWDVPHRDRRSTPRSILMAGVMLIVFGVFLLGGAILAGSSTSLGPIGAVASIAGSLLLNTMLFALAYRVLISRHVTWRDVTLGAVVAGVGWTVLLALGGQLVTSRIASASETYGTFAIVIGLLGWIYLGAQLMLLGAEANLVRSERLWPRSLVEPMSAADQEALRRLAAREARTEGERVSVGFDDSKQDLKPVAPNKKKRGRSLG